MSEIALSQFYRAAYEDWASEEGINNFHFNHCLAAWEAAIATVTAQRKAPQAEFNDPRVQTVYDILCGYDDPPMGEHWEGWVSRLIVDALMPAREVPQAVMAALDRMSTPLDESVLKGATAEADAHSMKVIRDYLLGKPRFPQTYCSQCGASLGSGNEGVSSCKDHK